MNYWRVQGGGKVFTGLYRVIRKLVVCAVWEGRCVQGVWGSCVGLYRVTLELVACTGWWGVLYRVGYGPAKFSDN